MPQPTASTFSLLRLLSLRSDQADAEVIDATVRDNARLGGTNLWVLMFAIVIASVGLNVNSTAVIIGAMLISPLMGPIMGIGYGAGVHDYALIRQSLRNLATFVGISLLASTLYFFLSPLKEAHSELLARTSPTIWDVLIAFFGGAAGMIGLTRKEKTTLIPGVAIATALMPPLCTTGYGIATGQPHILLGAFFLFLINGVFIALATLAIVRILRLPQAAEPDAATRRRGRAIIAVAVTLTLAPSLYLAAKLVQQEVFASRADAVLKGFFEQRDDITLISREINADARQVKLTLIGQGVTPDLEQSLRKTIASAGLGDVALKLRRPAEAAQDLGALRRELQQDLLHGTLAANEQKSARIAALETRSARLDATIADMARVEAEIRAQLPQVSYVAVRATRHQPAAGESNAQLQVLVAIETPRPLPEPETRRLRKWLEARLPGTEVDLLVGRRAR